jgi:hypothetical protein
VLTGFYSRTANKQNLSGASASFIERDCLAKSKAALAEQIETEWLIDQKNAESTRAQMCTCVHVLPRVDLVIGRVGVGDGWQHYAFVQSIWMSAITKAVSVTPGDAEAIAWRRGLVVPFTPTLVDTSGICRRCKCRGGSVRGTVADIVDRTAPEMRRRRKLLSENMNYQGSNPCP